MNDAHACADRPTMLLIDGSSYLYRAYHAMADLRGPDGEPTGAIHGFVAMLRRIASASTKAAIRKRPGAKRNGLATV